MKVHVILSPLVFKCGKGVAKFERHYHKLPKSLSGGESCHFSIFRSDLNVPISASPMSRTIGFRSKHPGCRLFAASCYMPDLISNPLHPSISLNVTFLRF
ncbi:hypothetical protein AVEN_180749-1 [Araneus ventricosus]|uniref:Uncharacterized protein n=1 Tax=Araneus ventricosus TaxID=182803 RepID=A0A4Y2RQE1_ARAVE|nr:hypothetical protein AVEN_117854-1 [Araneus ventricosus]GBN78042.1 hypothetical protein AVEN_180749-1 [Araneus ventricosus]